MSEQIEAYRALIALENAFVEEVYDPDPFRAFGFLVNLGGGRAMSIIGGGGVYGDFRYQEPIITDPSAYTDVEVALMLWVDGVWRIVYGYTVLGEHYTDVMGWVPVKSLPQLALEWRTYQGRVYWVNPNARYGDPDYHICVEL